MSIRPRAEADIPRLVSLADAVRAVDHWPPHRVGPTRDFLAGTRPLAAFVAADRGAIVGHVAVHDRSAGAVMALAAEAAGIDASGLSVVARLFVDRDRRGHGLGLELLRAAVEASRAAGRRPILDVWTELHPAIAVYERGGWRRLGDVTFTFRDPCGPDCLHSGRSVRSFVYSAPDE